MSHTLAETTKARLGLCQLMVFSHNLSIHVTEHKHCNLGPLSI